MITVACVLRSCGDFGPDWVKALLAGVSQHLQDFEFVCLTDMDGMPNAVPLKYDWPKWWAKMEVFRPGLFDGPTLYLDLDSLPVGDLSDIAACQSEFAMMSDFYRPERAQSGVMFFRPCQQIEDIWRLWIANPKYHMGKYRGDGEWLHDHSQPDRLQTLLPGQIVSIKPKGKLHPRCPEGARLVCGHGRPRLSRPEAMWAYKVWKARAA